MQKNRLIFAGVLFVLLLGIATMLKTNRTSTDDGAEAAMPTLPKIDKAKIDSLEIHRSGESITLTKVSDTEWKVTAPLEARADMTNVNAALERLTDLTVEGIAATNVENYAKLEIDDAKGVHVIAKSGATKLADLWIGAYRGGHTMMREEGKAPVLSVKGSARYAFDRAVKDWRHRMVVDTSPDSIGEVHFKSKNGDFHFKKDGTEWKPVAGQAAIERFGSAKVAALVSSVSHIRATDFGVGELTEEVTGLGADASTVEFSIASDGGAENVIVHIGKVKTDGNGEMWFKRDGDPVTYVITSFLAGKLEPSASDFQNPVDGGAPPPEAAEPPGGGMPMGMGGPGGGGQIPPELMRQIQEQMRQRQAGGGGMPPH